MRPTGRPSLALAAAALSLVSAPAAGSEFPSEDGLVAPRGGLAATVFPSLAMSCAVSHAHTDYYSFALRPTGKVTAVEGVQGRVDVGYQESPFALAVTRDGTISRRLEVSLDVRTPDSGVFVAWVADPELTTILRLGPVSEGRPAVGTVSLNKLVVFVTLEPGDEPSAVGWEGPVALVGRSRSARIQSMASHGSFETEDC